MNFDKYGGSWKWTPELETETFTSNLAAFVQTYSN